MNVSKKLSTAYRHVRLFRRNILTGMKPDTAKFEFICMMQAFSIPESIWKPALQSIDLDALNVFLKAPKRHHVDCCEIKPGMLFCLYPAGSKPVQIVVLEAAVGRDVSMDLLHTKKTLCRVIGIKPWTKPYLHAFSEVETKHAYYEQKATGEMLGWIDDKYADPLLEDENAWSPRELLMI